MIANDQVSVEPSGSAWWRPERPGCAPDAANGIGGLLAFSYGYSTSTGNWARHYHYRADANGNVTALVWPYNGNDYVVATDRYAPFGRLLGHTGTWLNPLRFSSQFIHQDSGLYDYGFRFYEPETQRWPQRWLTRDPLGEWGGINLYAFVGNDPVNGVDPYGLALFGLYDTYEEYLFDVSSVLIAEAQGAAANLSFGLYTPCFASELARQGGLVGDALATVGQFGTGVGSLVKGLTRGAFKESLKDIYKDGVSMTWRNIRRRMLRKGVVQKNEPVHHWLIHQSNNLPGWLAKYVNHPFNLMPITKEAHELAHYGNAWQYVWYGTPGWAKGAVGGIGYGTISRGLRGF